MADCEQDGCISHFIYCEVKFCEDDLKTILLTKMKKYGIQSSILTILQMEKRKLLTKEKAKKVAEGKLKNDPNDTEWKFYDGSLSDDLETFSQNLLHQKEIKEEVVWTFFLPKLTEEELKLVEEKNKDYMTTFQATSPDVDIEEMKLSDSKDKFVHTYCWRRTFLLSLEANNSLSEDSTADDISEISGCDDDWLLSEIIYHPFYTERLAEAEALVETEVQTEAEFKNKCCCNIM